MVIIISPQYASLIEASLDIPATGEARRIMLQLSAISLRILELIYCSKLLDIPRSTKVGKEQETTEFDWEEISQLVPLKNSNKMSQLVEQFMQPPRNPENN